MRYTYLIKLYLVLEILQLASSIDGHVFSKAVSNSHVQISDSATSQRNALEDLYLSTNGHLWINNQNWMTEPNVSLWYGVTADSSGNILKLFLNDNNLNGLIPESIADLTSVSFLYLYNNHIEGSLPSRFIQLLPLMYFSISNNLMTGSIPTEIGDLSSLVYFDLSANAFTGTLPSSFGSARNLKTLYLSDNLLQGSIPSSLGQAVGLSLCRLHSNSLQGTIPSELASWSAIKVLQLSGNSLSGIFPSTLASKLTLTSLQLSSNLFSGPILSFIKSTKLVYLYVSSNFFTGTVPSLVISGPKSTQISLDTNYFSGTLPSIVGLPTSVQYLSLAFNSISGSIPEAYFSFTNLLQLDLSRNHLTGAVSTKVSNFKLLKLLDLSVNSLSGVLPASLDDLKALTNLKLYLNRFSGFIPNLQHLSELTELSLDRNSFSGSLPWSLGALTSLTVLHLSGSQVEGESTSSTVSGAIPASFGNLTSLVELTICCQALSGSVPEELGQLTSLEVLNLGYNLLSGSLQPAMFGRFPVLTVLHLDNNNLNGCIPDSIGALKALVNLDLSRNKFSGNISTTIGQLGSLVGFFLSENSLSGSLPHEMGMMTSLAYLLLQQNRLEGSIPDALCAVKNLRVFSTSSPRVLCYPACLTRAINYYSTPSLLAMQPDFESPSRCHDDQDEAICSLIGSSNIRDEMMKLNSIFKITFESPHPYSNLVNLVEHVNVTGALEYEVNFDEWSDRFADDKLLFCADLQCRVILASYSQVLPTIKGGNSLILSVPSFFMVYTSSSCSGFRVSLQLECWGYAISITVTRKPSVSDWHCSTSTTPIAPLLALSIPTAPLAFALDVCDWRGVVCNSGIITELHLSQLRLLGSLPDNIGLLTGLRVMNFGFNSLSGPIPQSLVNLTALSSLDLSDNKLVGYLPTHLSSQLVTVDLQNNKLDGTIPVSYVSLKRLKTLSLSNNALSGSLSSHLCSTNSSIDISGNANMICVAECWQRNSNLNFGLMTLCAPTSVPTSSPTGPTSSPTFGSDGSSISNESKTVKLLTAILVPTILILCLSVFMHRRHVTYLLLKDKISHDQSLLALPIHASIYSEADLDSICQTIADNPETLLLLDSHGQSALSLATGQFYSLSLLVAVVEELLPIPDESTGVVPLPAYHGFAWAAIVQDGAFVDVVEEVLSNHQSSIGHLCYASDSQGRKLLLVGAPACIATLKKYLYFCSRYELIDPLAPIHRSATSILVSAFDCYTEMNLFTEPATVHSPDMPLLPTYAERSKVVLKFFKERRDFDREVSAYQQLAQGGGSLSPLIDKKTPTDSLFLNEISRMQWSGYRYLIVMHMAEKTLQEIIAGDRIAGRDWDNIKDICKGVAQAVLACHSTDLMHGSLQPRNIVRVNNAIKLIDFDSSASTTTLQYCSKITASFAAPELVYLDGTTDTYCLQTESITEDFEELPSDNRFVQASLAIDIWSLGLVFFEIFTGYTFFHQTISGDVDQENLESLFVCCDEWLASKLSLVANESAKALLSEMLMKDPSRRISIQNILTHSFMLGTSTSIKQFLQPHFEFDVFISYRTLFDKELAEDLNLVLTKAGLKVWMDVFKLKHGVNITTTVTTALSKSRVFLPLISRNATNHRELADFQFRCLTSGSNCDSFFLEFQLAVELQAIDSSRRIYPLFISDYDASNDTRRDCFDFIIQEAHLSEEVVRSVNDKVQAHLSRLRLKPAICCSEDRSVRAVYMSVVESLGNRIGRTQATQFDHVAAEVVSIIEANEH